MRVGPRVVMRLSPLLLLLLQPALVGSAVTRGYTRVPSNGTSFLSKFCFDFDKEATAGYFDVVLHRKSSALAADSNATALLLFLDDQTESYPDSSSGWDSYSCEEKQKRARWWKQIDLKLAASEAGFAVSVPMRQRVRPRWWFVTLVDCSGSAMQFEYVVHTRNPHLGWQSELSFDAYGVSQLALIFTLLNFFLALSQLYANDLVRGTSRSDHPMVRILTLGLLSSALSQLLSCAHYRRLTRDGEGLVGLYVLAKVLQALAKFLLMSMLLLVSRGRCVSRALSSGDSIKLLATLGPFSLLSCILEIWGELSASRTYTTDFVYATGCGHILILIDLALLATYFGNLQKSLEAEADPERRSFYKTWGVAFGLWFLSLPGIALLSYLLNPWVRFRVVLAVSSSCQAAAFAALVAGLWPTHEKPLLSLDMVVELESFGSEGYGTAGMGKGWQSVGDGPEGHAF